MCAVPVRDCECECECEPPTTPRRAAGTRRGTSRDRDARETGGCGGALDRVGRATGKRAARPRARAEGATPARVGDDRGPEGRALLRAGLVQLRLGAVSGWAGHAWGRSRPCRPLPAPSAAGHGQGRPTTPVGDGGHGSVPVPG
jgi:hypothetical protein